MSELSIVPCSLERHGAAILAIFNEAIANSTALYDYQPRAPESTCQPRLAPCAAAP